MQPGCWRWKISLSLSIGACNSLIPDIYRVVELFAGAGGLALGFEQAWLKLVLLNKIDQYACATLRHNRPDWRVIEGDVAQLSFQQLCPEKIDYNQSSPGNGKEALEDLLLPKEESLVETSSTEDLTLGPWLGRGRRLSPAPPC